MMDDKEVLMQKYRIVEEQEKTLRFDHFDNEDAWKLGCLIVEEARKKNAPIAIDIIVNGYKVFRFGFPKTNNYNEIWLTRKENTVNMMHVSTLKVHYMMHTDQEDIYGGGYLNPGEYAAMGGGFPIFVRGIGVIGVLAVSGLTHIEDHNMAVEGLCQYLHADVPRILE